jgi:hypothetical protein
MRDTTKRFEQRTVTLKAGDARTVGLGAYDNPRPVTDFDIQSTPDIGDNLGTSLEMVDIPGTPRVMGLYHLHNYGDTECNVTVSSRIIQKNGR